MQKITITLIIVSAYVISAKLSQLLAIEGTFITPVWPPSGIALAAVLIFGNMALIGVFIGCFIADFYIHNNVLILYTLLNAIGPSVGATIQAYLGKLALINFAGTDNIFKNLRSILTFILISAFAACLVNPTIGTFTLLTTKTINMASGPYVWLAWWIADAVGVVSMTSTIMAWYQKWQEKLSFIQKVKLLITWILILLVGYITFHSSVQVAYLLIPFTIWAAFQFPIQYSLLTALLISALCLYDTTYGYGFGNIPVTTSIILIQIFVSIVYLTTLLINAILSDRQRAYDNLQLLNEQLEKRVLERTKDLTETNKQLEIQKNKVMDAFEALKQSHARLMQSEKMASLGVLTAGVAHEIKNPLNAMSANIITIEKNMNNIVHSIDQVQIDETIKNEINRINSTTGSLFQATDEGIKRTAGIIADLCAFARSDEQEMMPTDLNRNIDSTLNLLSSEIKSNIKVIKEYGQLPPLYCHPGKINQVIMNILINAIHALQNRQDAKIIIKTQCQDDSIVLSIKDNGPGMKKEILDKIFVPFFTTKTDGLGSGLGLFISNNIIKEHNGTILVKSEIDKGTEFIITLPIKGL